MSQHKYLTNNDNHPTVSLVFADSTARASATNPITGSAYTSDDIGRMCFQSDTEAFYLLQDTTPTWLTAGSAASGISDIVEDLTPQLGGNLDANGKSIENAGAIESQVNTNATTGATETLDTSLYDVHDMTMDQNCTFTFSNPAPSGDNTTFMLILRGAYTPTLPASVDWSGGAAPTYTTPSVYLFTTVDAGTTWLGSQVGSAFA